MKPSRFFWTAQPAQALAEAWFIGLGILFLLSLQVGAAGPAVLNNGILFLCGVCGMWCVLRIRIPQGGWLHQGLWELAVGLALSLVMAAGLRLPAAWLGWESVWLESTLRTTALVTLVLVGTGPAYVIARGGVRLWLLWDRLRRQRLLWAMTHAQLTVVVLVILAVAAAGFVVSMLSNRGPSGQSGSGGLLAAVMERLLHTVFPAMTAVFFMTLLALLVLLPPAALFSFLVARRTTRRLEALAEAAQALRQGSLDSRVAVTGEDEVAQLQADFNAMAGELEQTLHDLERQRDRVARLLQSRRELVAGVSHELRTPVATVRAVLETALEGQAGTLADPLQQDLQAAQHEVLRLQGLIDDLFTLSQAEAGGLALDCQLTDIGPIVAGMVDSAAPLAWNAGRVEVVADLPEGLPRAWVDEARLQQVLANLLHNAIRHTPPGGIVAVGCRPAPDAVVVEVCDTGEGIAPEDLPRIWARFYRGHNVPDRGVAGGGLGLALVKELTEAMGGTVGVESRVGEGSCFVVRLGRGERKTYCVKRKT